MTGILASTAKAYAEICTQVPSVQFAGYSLGSAELYRDQVEQQTQASYGVRDDYVYDRELGL